MACYNSPRGEDVDDSFADKMAECSLCGLRKTCRGVVTPAGNLKNPILLICGDAPGIEEDDQGEPFSGKAGTVLREILRSTGCMNRQTAVMTNVINCRPPRSKFPRSKEIPTVCKNKWLFPMIEALSPERMLLLGGVALEHVAGVKGITRHRGQWFEARGVRTMSTWHPSYVMRKDQDGYMDARDEFTREGEE
jgi:DNA polymerase